MSRPNNVAYHCAPLLLQRMTIVKMRRQYKLVWKQYYEF